MNNREVQGNTSLYLSDLLEVEFKFTCLPVMYQGNSFVKAATGDEMLKNTLSVSNEALQEERRMSDLSDWASSITSAADIQVRYH